MTKSILVLTMIGLLAGCSSSDDDTTMDGAADASVTDAVATRDSAPAACTDSPSCVSCAGYLAGVIAGEVLTPCQCDGTNGGPSSYALLAAVTQCTCQEMCVSECASTCAGGQADDSCVSCTSSKCPTEYSACSAKTDGMTIMTPDASPPDAAARDAAATDAASDSGSTDGGSDAGDGGH